MSCLALTLYEEARASIWTICLILNLSLNGIMTDVGKFTFISIQIIWTSFQSIPIISQIMFFYSIYSGINFPVILNKCMLPTVQNNLTGM